MMTTSHLVLLVLFIAAASFGPHPSAATPQEQTAAKIAINEELLDAARGGDITRVMKALDGGADVNAANRYKATALTFAADKGHLDVVRLLVDRGADPNIQDTFYKSRAIDMAGQNGHIQVAILLLEKGSLGAGGALRTALGAGSLPLLHAALNGRDLTRDDLALALAAARRRTNAEAAAAIEKKIASMPPDPNAVTVDRRVLQSYVGTYRNEGTGFTLVVTLSDDQLSSAAPGSTPSPLVPTSETSFRVMGREATMTFAGRGNVVERALLDQNGATQTLERVAAIAASSAGSSPPAPSPAAPADGAAEPEPAPVTPAKRGPAMPWPAFRGANAAGNGDGQGAVTEWNIDTGRNVRWKTPMPGISNASPIIWGDHIFVVSAVSSAGDRTFRTGLYGDVKPVEDLSAHTWKMFCLDRKTGRILWDRTAFTGLPKVKRHSLPTWRADEAKRHNLRS